MLSDFHTIKNSLDMNGKIRQDTIISHRGYITDGLDVAVLLPVHNDAEEWLEQLAFAIQQPHFTPYLGRRSNPFSAPLAEPDEKVVKVQYPDELYEQLFLRLSKLQVGDLQPAKYLLRIPIKLRNETDTFLSKWSFTGKDVVAENRPGFLRFFKNKTRLGSNLTNKEKG